MADSSTSDTTIAAQMENHNYPNDSVLIYDYYLYLLFVYLAFGAMIAGGAIFISYKTAKREEALMVKRVDYFLRLTSILQIINVLIVLGNVGTISLYWKLIGEFFTALVGFFNREHQVFRWLSLFFQSALVIVNILFMVWVMQDVYCYERDVCESEMSYEVMMLQYSQFVIGFIFEIIGIVLCTNLMMSLGWFYTKRFPRTLNLEQYGVKRPSKKITLYDLLPHSIVYQS